MTQIDLHGSYEILRKELDFIDFKQNKAGDSVITEAFQPVLFKILDALLGHSAVQGIIHKTNGETFDVMISKMILLQTLTEQKLIGAINEILKPKYKDNIKELT